MLPEAHRDLVHDIGGRAPVRSFGTPVSNNNTKP
jgi:hypothetical protein